MEDVASKLAVAVSPPPQVFLIAVQEGISRFLALSAQLKCSVDPSLSFFVSLNEPETGQRVAHTTVRELPMQHRNRG